MIGSFYDAFKSTEQPRVLPSEVVDELSKELPRGYRYEMSEDGRCMVVPDENEASARFCGDVDYAANGIPESISRDKLVEYMYRTQKQIKFKSVCMTDGERTVPIEDMYRDPLTHERSETVTEVWARPYPFPPPKVHVLSDGEGTSQEVSIRRVPYDSMSAVKFVNFTFPALAIEVIIYERDGEESQLPAGGSSIRVSARPTKAKSVHDAVVALTLMKAFGAGTLRIDGVPLSSSLHYRESQKDRCEQVGEALSFWQTLERLEEVLGVEFDPSVECDNECADLLRSLAYSFLDERDVVITKPLVHFHIEFAGDENIDELEGHIGRSGLSLSFVDVINANVMGASFSVCEANVLVDMVLERVVYDGDDKGAELYIADAPGASFKVVKRIFRTEQEALDGMGAMYERHAEYRLED